MTLLILEKQPVQYRAPLYAELHCKCANAVEVLYGSRGAVTQAVDPEFGSAFAWDIPLLEGYPHTVVPDRMSLARAVWNAVSDRAVQAVLLTDFTSRISIWAMGLATLMAKPVWVRMETQDQAYPRSPAKSLLRSACYQLLYALVSRALAIGELNRCHYERHGLPSRQIDRVPYVVVNPLAGLSLQERQERRAQLRQKLGMSPETQVVAFFGKLIPKKQPDLLIQAHGKLPTPCRARSHLLFVGSGVLEATLREQCERLDIASTFAGFINQSQIHDYYLASDIVCLPSRQMGETWGLTVNEGLQAGCAILVSEHVGCSVEFGTWERVRICRSEDATDAAHNLAELMEFETDLDWCAPELTNSYSMASASRDWVAALARNGISGRRTASLAV